MTQCEGSVAKKDMEASKTNTFPLERVIIMNLCIDLSTISTVCRLIMDMRDLENATAINNK